MFPGHKGNHTPRKPEKRRRKKQKKKTKTS
jgi:hypothetical protein